MYKASFSYFLQLTFCHTFTTTIHCAYFILCYNYNDNDNYNYNVDVWYRMLNIPQFYAYPGTGKLTKN